MALRLLEVTVPTARTGDLTELLKDHEVIDRWSVGRGEERSVERLLLRPGMVEGLTDRLTDRFGAEAGFRILLLAVEATLPDPTADESVEVESREESEPELGRVSREELYQELEGGGLGGPIYLLTVVLSTLVAAVGLLRDDVAVIIGAMVIAPLLKPNMALALATTLGDLDLGKRALKANAIGAAVALAVASVAGLVVTVDGSVPALAARTTVGMDDLVLALAAGSAGALAYTTGLPAAVLGVMVAVALLPPLVTSGLFLGAGAVEPAFRAGVLVLTNVTCVNLAAVATFLAQRVRPRTWWEAERAKRATRIAVGLWLGMIGLLAVLILWYW
jgi:uncharacterized hydrophobic protein (TIGR00341 family)